MWHGADRMLTTTASTPASLFAPPPPPSSRFCPPPRTPKLDFHQCFQDRIAQARTSTSASGAPRTPASCSHLQRILSSVRTQRETQCRSTVLVILDKAKRHAVTGRNARAELQGEHGEHGKQEAGWRTAENLVHAARTCTIPQLRFWCGWREIALLRLPRALACIWL